jgi:hypothetical protein
MTFINPQTLLAVFLTLDVSGCRVVPTVVPLSISDPNRCSNDEYCKLCRKSGTDVALVAVIRLGGFRCGGWSVSEGTAGAVAGNFR